MFLQIMDIPFGITSSLYSFIQASEAIPYRILDLFLYGIK